MRPNPGYWGGGILPSLSEPQESNLGLSMLVEAAPSCRCVEVCFHLLHSAFPIPSRRNRPQVKRVKALGHPCLPAPVCPVDACW